MSDKLLDLEGLTERVDALMIEAVVHFTSIRVFGEGAGDKTYELGNMMRKLESGTDSEQDATTVRRHDLAAIWVAFSQECSAYDRRISLPSGLHDPPTR